MTIIQQEPQCTVQPHVQHPSPYPLLSRSPSKLNKDPSEAQALFRFQQLPASSLTQLSISSCKAPSRLSLGIASASLLLGRLRPRKTILRLGHMPDPSDTTHSHYSAPPSSDQAASHSAQAYGHYNAPEGNAYAQGVYATPNQAFLQDTPLIHQDQSTQQPHRAAPSPFPGRYS